MYYDWSHIYKYHSLKIHRHCRLETLLQMSKHSLYTHRHTNAEFGIHRAHPWNRVGSWEECSVDTRLRNLDQQRRFQLSNDSKDLCYSQVFFCRNIKEMLCADERCFKICRSEYHCSKSSVIYSLHYKYSLHFIPKQHVIQDRSQVLMHWIILSPNRAVLSFKELQLGCMNKIITW